MVLAACSRPGSTERMMALSAGARFEPAATASSLVSDRREAVAYCADGAIAGAHVLTRTFHVPDLAGGSSVWALLTGYGFGGDPSHMGPVVYNAWVTYSLAFLGVPQDQLPAQVRAACTDYVTGPGFEPYELALLCRWKDSYPICTDPRVAPSAAGMGACDIQFARYVQNRPEVPVGLRTSRVNAWGCAGPYVQLEVSPAAGTAPDNVAIYDISLKHGGVLTGAATLRTLGGCDGTPRASLAALASQVATPENPC